MFPCRREYVWTGIDLWNRFRVRRRPRAALKQMGYGSKMVACRAWIITRDGKVLKPNER